MPVIYNGNSLIPAPFVSISRNNVRDDGGDVIRREYEITLNGTIVNIGNDKDSPGSQTDNETSIGDANQMEGVLSEQKRLRKIFAVQGGRLEISSPGGGGPSTIDAYCQVDNIEFEEGVWTNRCDYTIQLTTHEIAGDPLSSSPIDTYSENWDFQENINGTFNVSHQLSAVGAKIYSSSGVNDPLNEARLWVRRRAYSIDNNGNLTVNSSGTLNFGDLISNVSDLKSKSWNYKVSESPGTSDNSWNLTENWIYVPSGEYIENWSVSTQNDENRSLKTVNIRGSITGLADRESNTSKRNESAESAWNNTIQPNLYVRASNEVSGGFSVRTEPISKQVTRQKTEGVLSYDYTYSAGSGTLIANAISENVNINDSGGSDVFATIDVPGREKGPVVQNMKTKDLPERSININATLAPISSIGSTSSLKGEYLNKPDTDDIISALVPSNGNYYLRENAEQFNPITREYSRTVSWVIDSKSSDVDGMPTSINNKA